MNTWRPPLLSDPPLAGQRPFEITNPAVVVAVSLCWLARSPQTSLTLAVRHESCDWCAYPPDVLISSVNDFWRDDDAAHTERAFRQLPKVVQQRLVEEAAHEQPTVTG
jgi:hypothetical protein